MANQESAKVQAGKALNAASGAALRQRPGDVAALRSVYLKEKLVPVYLSPMYRPYLGKVMNVDINGVSVFVPIDGQTYNVPLTFADEITRRRMAVDAMLTKQDRMADIHNNHEGSPGELKMF